MPTDPTATRAAVARLAAEPHRRYNPLTDEWVLVSAGRTRRPWLGAEEPDAGARRDRRTTRTATCAPATSGRTATSIRDYAETFVFTNDFAALRPDTSTETFDDGLLRAEGERGSCRVVCFSPRHDLTLGRMERERGPPRRRRLGRADGRARAPSTAGSRSSRTGARRWAPRTRTRTARSGPATALPGRRARARTRRSGAHLAATGRRMLLDYVDHESGGQRVIVETDEWLDRRAVLGRLAVRDPARSRSARPRG